MPCYELSKWPSYVRWKCRVTVVRKCFRDVDKNHLEQYSTERNQPFAEKHSEFKLTGRR